MPAALRAPTVGAKAIGMQPATVAIFALAHPLANYVFAGFLVVSVFVLAFGLYTRKGSGINQHPYADLDHNSGRETPSELAHDITQDVKNWDRGVAGHPHHRPRAVAPTDEHR
jgi:hypothetical protein